MVGLTPALLDRAITNEPIVRLARNGVLTELAGTCAARVPSWIERTYHRRRRQTALGRLTPIEYEMTMTPQTETAA